MARIDEDNVPNYGFQYQPGGDYVWQNDVNAMEYKPPKEEVLDPRDREWRQAEGDRARAGFQVSDPRDALTYQGPPSPEPDYAPYGDRIIDVVSGKYRVVDPYKDISDPRDAFSYQGPPTLHQDYQASQAWGDYNYNPPNGFSYDLPPGTPSRPVYYDATGRDSQAWSDYNYNPPESVWGQKPSNYYLPGERLPSRGAQRKADEMGMALGNGGAPGGLQPTGAGAPPRNAPRYGGWGGGRGGFGSSGGSGRGFVDYGGQETARQNNFEAGLMNWRF